MDLLVDRYGYPVAGAAGLVGNLIAESGVQPNRIEGSHTNTPMRAPDFTGRVRDFPPDEVRDRSYGRRAGPRHPGVGLAQWTSPNRRTGLLRHTFQGRQLGSAILSDLDAQVDYLVSELRTGYRPVNAVLMAPGVTVDQASDEVLLRFEIPAAVLNKPRTDPASSRCLPVAGGWLPRRCRSTRRRRDDVASGTETARGDDRRHSCRRRPRGAVAAGGSPLQFSLV